MKIHYKPKGVCSRAINIDVEDGIIKDLEILGGCSGNLQGICALAKGRPVKDVMELLSGIHCGAKSTSCPDQLAIALTQAVSRANSV
ncbi:TIGR03905 family TSCPD domain-containing protein [Oscillospiraceae bacterium PP1C4]